MISSYKLLSAFNMKFIYLVLIACISLGTNAGGNESIESFSKAKKNLERYVYMDHRETIYCSAEFDAKKNVIPPAGFTTAKHKKRAKRIEWEHVVPAENFGRTFSEWREGHPSCVSKKGKSFKGRKCASKMNKEYRLMQSDMYNLFPAIGAVNAMKSNYNFVAQVNAKSGFGSCDMKIDNRKAEPPIEARGRIARTYLYMDATYKRYSMSKTQKQLMNAWDRMYPVSTWECSRAKKIEKLQINENRIMKKVCD
jgi:deoxyribonuclease-1